MAKQKTPLERLCTKPVPTDFTWKELCELMSGFGYAVKNGEGSRRKFVHREKGLILSCHEPHPRPLVKQYLIRQIVEHLRDNGFISGKQ